MRSTSKMHLRTARNSQYCTALSVCILSGALIGSIPLYPLLKLTLPSVQSQMLINMSVALQILPFVLTQLQVPVMMPLLLLIPRALSSKSWSSLKVLDSTARLYQSHSPMAVW